MKFLEIYSPDVHRCFINFPSEVHREPVSKVGSLSPAEHLVWFEPGTFQFNYNALTHDDQGISW